MNVNRIEIYHAQLVEEKQKKILAGIHKSPELDKPGFQLDILNSRSNNLGNFWLANIKIKL